MNKQEIDNMNEGIIRSIAKKIMDTTSAEKMPFSSLSLSVTKFGYGFAIRTKEKDMFTARSGDRFFVHIENTGNKYKQSFVISEPPINDLTTEVAIESYKKHCINTVYSLYKNWLKTIHDEKPNLGTYYQYKY